MKSEPQDPFLRTMRELSDVAEDLAILYHQITRMGPTWM
jgi:hypothetical protein